MSDTVLIKTNDGRVHLVEGRTKDGRTPAAGDGVDGGVPGRVVEDVVDLSVGARTAEKIRAESDPSKLADSLREGAEDIARTTQKFSALLGRPERGLARVARSIGDLFKEILARLASIGKTDA